MIVLSDVVDTSPAPTRNQGLLASVEIAQLLELPVYPIQVTSTALAVAPALAQVPPQSSETAGVWIGETPTSALYVAIYQQALQKGIRLLNSPAEHQTIQNFEQIYNRLHDLIPTSVVVTHVNQCEAAIAQLGLPISVRGEASFNPLSPHATTLEELQQLTTPLLQQPRRSHNNVILQAAIPLRSYQTPIGMKLGRIFRIVLYRQTLITYGYAWSGDHPGRYLSTPEEEALMAVVFGAIAQIDVPFVSLDVGQLETGNWTVLGMGDPQFTGTPEIPWIQFWGSMREITLR
ncbi:MAG: ATP-grasp domain-containing protein [Oculatellaceae cyanobacterium bins.114]|nr:ATP-grasp domain-containing protein [Oculatellaceae cyanobacterium bins.114]